ncbi:MAG: hypothetical protein ACLTJ8_01040 [Veillonella atypica]
MTQKLSAIIAIPNDKLLQVVGDKNAPCLMHLAKLMMFFAKVSKAFDLIQTWFNQLSTLLRRCQDYQVTEQGEAFDLVLV